MPLVADINVTKFCNLRCKHCYASLESVRDVPEPTTEELKALIDEIYGVGARWVRLLGGEPLLREDFGELVDYINSKGMLSEVSTNGILIPKKIEELKRIDTICISIDGGGEEHNLLRGEGTWKKVINGIECAISNGLEPRLHCVLTRYSMNSIKRMNDIASKYSLRFNFGECAFIDYPDPNFKLTNEEGRKFYNKYLEAKKNGFRISNSEKCIEYMLRWGSRKHYITYKDVEKDPLIRMIFPECQYGYKYVFIDVDGAVYTCPRRWKVRGSNYKEVGLKQAWIDAYKNRDCYICKEMGCIERALIFGGDLGAIFNAYFGFV
jgi:MoaA/NifB/PqqE/SkfB family radical SAM enzyme